jgi:DHA1 family solute carrier family 18 vesicular amine transporter 1/2
VPTASTFSQLAVPHFGLGLGIGVVDAALVPLLASLMDCRYSAHYGSVYALQQMAVSLAYSLGRKFLPVVPKALSVHLVTLCPDSR